LEKDLFGDPYSNNYITIGEGVTIKGEIINADDV